MNPYVPDSDGSFHYYDSDYPWPEDLVNDPDAQAIALRQGILHDVPHYARLAGETRDALGRPLRLAELACGTGRLAIPLARAGHRLWAVDVSKVMLAGLDRRLRAEPAEVAERLVVLNQNLADLDLPERNLDLIILGFNILMLVADFDSQLALLERVRDHLAPGGRLALDVANPLVMPLVGSNVPEVSYTRINRRTGNLYSKFAMVSTLNDRQVQAAHGWYDEVMPGGAVRRSPYGFEWRPIFRYELELMLRLTGFQVERLDGGFNDEAFEAASTKIVVLARKG